jgi:hypothetical protein
MEKYKELYDYATDVFQKEHDRFTRADEKATKFAGISVFLVGVNAFFTRAVLDTALPPKSCFEWLMVTVGVAAISASAAGWYVANSVIRLSGFHSRPLNQGILDFFRTSYLVNVYYGLAQRIMVVHQKNLAITERKYKKIRKADIILRFSVAATLALALLYAIHRYNIAIETPASNH